MQSFVSGSGTLTPDVSLVNCKFIGNEARNGSIGNFGSGGAIYVGDHVEFDMVNCTLSGNSSNSGGAITFDNSGGTSTITNCILWDDTASSNPEVRVITGGPTINYTDIEGGWSGSGGNNKNVNPNFDSNYRLQCGSQCVNAGQDSSVPTDALDVNEDGVTGEDAPDLDLLTRIVTVVDMGAYEKQPEFCIADISNNGVVNVNDLLAVINQWGSCPTPCSADVNAQPCGDGTVNVNDLLAVINAWGACPGFAADESIIPTSVQDCMDMCSLEYEPFSSGWQDCVDKCVLGLCEAQIIDCD